MADAGAQLMDGSMTTPGATTLGPPVLEVEDLRTVFLTDAGVVRAVYAQERQAIAPGAPMIALEPA